MSAWKCDRSCPHCHFYCTLEPNHMSFEHRCTDGHTWM